MRLFVALDLPATAKAALPTPTAPWRAVPSENLHITLAFLGDADPARTAEALEQVPVPAVPLDLSFDDAVLLPPRRPRVLAVRVHDAAGAASTLQQDTVSALDELFEPETRPWLPHITIGRAREPVPRGTELPHVERHTFTPTALTLYASAGGRYEPRWSRPF